MSDCGFAVVSLNHFQKEHEKMPKKSPSARTQDSSKTGNQQSAISNPLVAVIMGSKSDWETMRHADETLTEFGVAHECHVMSAHRTPHLASEFSATAASRGLEVIIA